MCVLWWNDQDLGHCFVVPLAAVWIIWRERRRWLQIPAQPEWAGVPVILLGAAMQAAGVLGLGVFTTSVALLVTIAGAVLTLGGFRILRAWAFPLSLLVFMLPKLVAFYNQVTLPLQLLATRLAAGLLLTIGVSAVREGNILNVGGHLVAVTDACNGLRYLLSLGFVAALFGYAVQTKPWIRVALLLATAPLAILGNALRVAAAAYIPALDRGTLHELAGAAIFSLCVSGLMVLRLMLSIAPGRRNV
jgi:exosortase